MGHQVLELEKTEGGLKIVCQLHHYYQANCSCGHESKSQPGEGITSIVKGRTRNLKLTEYVLVGNVFATLIASLGVRYRLSRSKVQEFLIDWLGIKLSVGTIDRCIREAGIACEPVVEELLAQLQVSEIRPIDETPWYQKGKLYWLWVAIESQTAVFRIAPRTKEEFKQLVTEAFVGWLITDGYGAYRHQERRQRCLAHLIRKASSRAYSSLLSVIETCRLRQINPWGYISEVIKLARKGLSPPPIPISVVT